MTINKLPSVLAFNRKLEPSDGIMLSGHWDNIDTNDKTDWQPIELFERRNRAVKSNFKPDVLANEEELQKQIAEANLSWGDDAALNDNHDTLQLKFSLRIIPEIEVPTICNEHIFEARFKEVIADYIQDNLNELAHRYAYNIANGRFLWRNRVGAQEIKIKVNHSSLKTPLLFNAYNFPLAQTKDNGCEDLGKLEQLILEGFKGNKVIILEISAYARLGNRQRVWPSQEMILNTPKGEKSRSLFFLKNINGVEKAAAMHSEKIGNALRTIDDWYPDYSKTNNPIAVEAYGSVTQRGIAYRSSKNDFKTLLLKWLNDKTTEQIKEEEKHFVMAMLIRGGVFSEKES